nr:uncharacterized protein LOC117680519 [Crassostrea gigas]
MQLTLIVGLIEITVAGQLCMNCMDLSSPQECSKVTRCGNHQQCYIEKYVRHNAIYYDLGCKSNVVCSSIGGPQTSIVGRRKVMLKEGAPDSFEVDFDEDDDGKFPVCESCCNTTACNNGGSCGVAGMTIF